jgi:type IV pilus assembly protein PilP
MKALRFAVLTGAVIVAAGCGPSDQEQLSQKMAEIRSSLRPSVPKLEEPKRFEPFVYKASGALDPFDPRKVAQAQARLAARSTSGLRPDLDRVREPLEAFPLDTMAMVGTLNRNGQRVGLVQIDKVVYQVRVGNYLGQNFGKVTGISETEITMKEIVQDAVGDWTERSTTLQLQEAKK